MQQLTGTTRIIPGTVNDLLTVKRRDSSLTYNTSTVRSGPYSGLTFKRQDGIGWPLAILLTLTIKGYTCG